MVLINLDLVLLIKNEVGIRDVELETNYLDIDLLKPQILNLWENKLIKSNKILPTKKTKCVIVSQDESINIDEFRHYELAKTLANKNWKSSI